MIGAFRAGLRVAWGAPQSLPDNRLVRRPPGHAQPDATSRWSS